MASIQVRKETGTLIIDFYFQGQRCREQTMLADNSANRKRLSKVLAKIEEQIFTGTFNYRDFFPGSKNAGKFDQPAPIVQMTVIAHAVGEQGGSKATPMFKDFAETWFAEKSVEWRTSHKKTVRDDIDKRLIPRFGEIMVGNIMRIQPVDATVW